MTGSGGGRTGARPTALVAVAAMLLSCGCQSFLPPEGPAPQEARPGETTLGTTYVRKRHTVEVEGRFQDGKFHAARIELEEDDEEITLKGALSSWTPSEGGAIGGITFVRTGKSRFVDEGGKNLDPSAFAIGDWAKAECRERGGRLELRKISLRVRGDDEAAEIQGRVTDIDHARGLLSIGSISISFPSNVLVVWDVANQDPPGPQDRRLGVVERGHAGLRRVRRVDDEDRRPDEQLVIGDFLTVGGEIQYDTQWRNNHNLRDASDRDRLLHDIESKLELSFDISPHLFAFTQINARQRIVHFDQDGDDDTEFDIDLSETFVLLEDLPIPGVSLQVGRQDFDHGREWVMDQILDAARIYVNLDKALLEVSVSTFLFDAPDRHENVTNYLVGLHAEPWRKQEFFAYFLHRKGGTFFDLSRTHVGLSGEGELGPWTWWLDFGIVWGSERERFFPGPFGEFTREVTGYAYDVAVMYKFEDTPTRPYVFGGFAWATGDDDDFGRRDGNYKPTGLQDYSARFGGVTSYRYLGELFRPELSNLMVFTLGGGFRPWKRTSVDLIFHHYRQVESASFLAPSRLRTAPNGMSTDIGSEVDLVIGIEDYRPVEIEIVLSYFNPGSAFDGEDDAWFVTFEIEWNF